MAKHGTASTVSGSFVEFSCAVMRNLPRDLEPEVMDGWTGNGESLARILRESLASPTSKTVSPMEVLWSVASDGRSFDEIIVSIEAKGRQVSDWAKDLVKRSGEKPTTGVVYNFVGIKGDDFPTDRERTTEKIFAEAKRRKLPKPTVESALLLAEKYSQAELEKTGYRYFPVLHELVRDADAYPNVLALRRRAGRAWLDSWNAHPTPQWDRESLFLFLQVS